MHYCSKLVVRAAAAVLLLLLQLLLLLTLRWVLLYGRQQRLPLSFLRRPFCQRPPPRLPVNQSVATENARDDRDIRPCALQALQRGTASRPLSLPAIVAVPALAPTAVRVTWRGGWRRKLGLRGLRKKRRR